jgi:hypothetical protein
VTFAGQKKKSSVTELFIDTKNNNKCDIYRIHSHDKGIASAYKLKGYGA